MLFGVIKRPAPQEYLCSIPDVADHAVAIDATWLDCHWLVEATVHVLFSLRPEWDYAKFDHFIKFSSIGRQCHGTLVVLHRPCAPVATST
jgi:hypothetical protein